MIIAFSSLGACACQRRVPEGFAPAHFVTFGTYARNELQTRCDHGTPIVSPPPAVVPAAVVSLARCLSPPTRAPHNVVFEVAGAVYDLEVQTCVFE